MMTDFPSAQLESICEEVVDCPHSTPKWTDSGIVVIRSQNIRGGRLNFSSTSFTDEETYKKRSKRIELAPDDLIITREAPMGEVCIIPEGLRCCLGQRMVALRANTNLVLPEFLLFALQDPHVQHQINVNEGTGSTVSNMRIPVLKALEIPLPSIPDQKAIAHILSVLDDKIALNQKMNQTIEEIAKAVFNSWFVDFDPVRAKSTGRNTGLSHEISKLFPKELINTEIGEIPKGWKISSLSDVFDIQGGSQPPAKTFIGEEREGYIRLLQIRDYDTSAHETFVPLQKNLRVVDENDVLIGRYGSGNGKFMEDSLGRPLRGLSGAINVAVVKTIPKLENSREFVANMISSGLFYKWIVGGSARAVQAGFKKEDLDYIKLAVPPPDILAVFEEFGILVWERTKAFRDENKILSELRNTLLPKLISGKLQILDAKKLLEEAGI